MFFSSSYEWLFSGLLVPLIYFFIKSRSSSSNNVTQKKIKSKGDVIGRDKNNNSTNRENKIKKNNKK